MLLAGVQRCNAWFYRSLPGQYRLYVVINVRNRTEEFHNELFNILSVISGVANQKTVEDKI